jgi:hypothetical protein
MATALKQIPEVIIGRQIKKAKIPGGFIWGVCFKLPVPAEQDGYIIQHIIQDETGPQINPETKVKESRNQWIQYWEAWEVKKGETEPRQKQSVREFVETQGGGTLTHGDYSLPMNDIFYRNYKIGAQGTYIITGHAGFYQETLPSDFIVGHSKTGAGALKSTLKKPPFWTQNGLFRQVKLNYYCETEVERNDLSKQSLNGDPPHIRDLSWMDTWS